MMKLIWPLIVSVNRLKNHLGINTGRWGGPFLGRNHLECGGEPVRKIFDRFEICFDPPLECDLGIKNKKISFDESWLYKYQNATVISSPGGLHGISQNGSLIPGFCLLNEDFFFKTRLLVPKPKLVVDKGFILESSHSANYYHWCVEILPVLGLIPKLNGMKAITLIRNIKRKLHIQKVTEGLFDTFFHDCPILVRELYTVSGLFPIYGAFRPEPVLNFWKKSGGNAKNIKRIYLTRKNASRRRLVNENQILGILRPLGFEAIDCDILDLTEQKKVFESAEIVVGIHGAGLTNLIHCQEETKVIEIFGPGFRHFFYEYISKIFGLEYQSVQPLPLKFKDPLEAHCGNFRLDEFGIDQLNQALRYFGL